MKNQFGATIALFVSIAAHGSGPQQPVEQFPSQLNCSEFVNQVQISNRNGKWYAINSNHFSDAKKRSRVGEIEVSIVPTAYVGQYSVSAVDPEVYIATSLPKNDGDVLFRNMIVTLSRDYVAAPATARLRAGNTTVTYTCCAGAMKPPEQGQGFCKF